jgi:DNA-binding transcriptional LysR family regulator
MNPKYLAQLATIVELGSVTKAAQRLNTTQPTLSRIVKMIEDRVGSAVLRRGRYGVAPTEIGMRLAEEGREILLRSQKAEATIKQQRRGLSGELRAGVGPMLATAFMGDFLAEILGTPLGYELKVFCDLPARIVEHLKIGRLDVAVIPYDLNRREEPLARERLFRDQLAVFVSRKDPLAGRSGVAVQELSAYHWISVGDVTGLFDVTREMLDHLGLHDVEPRLEINGDVSTILSVLARSKACCMLPLRLLMLNRDRFGIAPVDLTERLPTRDIALWTTVAGRERPETVDFLRRITLHLARLGLD